MGHFHFISIDNNFLAAYNNQHYQEAENIFSQLPTELLNEVEFYRGICLYQLDKKDEAKAIFRKYKQDPTSTYYEASLWYFSLTHLVLNENDSAITLLNKVKNDPLISFHKEDAIEIIKQLK
jgi:tetratricopeptide (TPR) repeat protein